MNNKSIGLCVIFLGTSLLYFIYPEDSLNLEWLKDNQRPLDTFYRENSLTVMVSFVALFLVIGLFLLSRLMISFSSPEFHFVVSLFNKIDTSW